MADALSFDPSGSATSPDLYRLMSRMPGEADRIAFLENVYKRMEKCKPSDMRCKMIFQQITTLLAPFYESQKRWLDAGRLFEESAYYEQALGDYLKEDAFGDAARCAELSGDLKAAEQLYLKANMLLHAAEVSLGLGDQEKSRNMFVKAISYFVEQKDFRQAALAAEKAGMMKESLLLQSDQIEHVGYVDSKLMYQDLVERAINIGDIELALDLATRGELYDKAIDLALKNNRIDAVPKYYQQYLDSKYAHERAPIFQRYLAFLTEHGTVGAVKTAVRNEVEFLKKDEEFMAAANLANEAKMPEAQSLYRRAMELSESKADFALAALAATKLGLSAEADYYRNLATFVG